MADANTLQAAKSRAAGVSTSAREEVDITWTIENFRLVVDSSNLFISQYSDANTDIGDMTPSCAFSVGSSKGVESDKIPLKFTLHVTMRESEKEGDKIGLYVSLLNPKYPTNSPVLVTLSSLKVMVGNEVMKAFSNNHMVELKESSDWGYNSVVTMSEIDKYLDDKGSLTFKAKMVYFKPPCKLLQLQQNWSGTDTVAIDQLQTDIKRLLGDEMTSDVVIKVTGTSLKSFFAHKAILAARSNVFYAMFFKSEMKESFTGVVEVSDISVKTMEVFLYFIYTGCFKTSSIKMEMLSELIYAADKYDVKTLKDFCEESIIHNLTAKNAMELFQVSKRHALHETSFGILQFIAKNISDIL